MKPQLCRFAIQTATAALLLVPRCIADGAVTVFSQEEEIERRVWAAQQSLQSLRLHEAEQHLLAALALPASTENRATILNNLGFVYHQSGMHLQAEACYRRAIEAWKQVRGPDALETVRTINNLATHYAETLQFAKLERLGLASLASSLSGQETARRDLAQLLGNLGVLARSKGEYTEAVKYLSQSLEIWESVAPRGPEWLAPLNNLALMFEQAGREDTALSYYDRAQQVAAETLPPGDYRWASLLGNIATLHFRARRFGLAASFHRRALDIAESALGPEHPLVGQILCNYAVVLRAQKKGALAGRLEARALAILGGPSVNLHGRRTIDASDLARRTPPKR
ncbi:tetratricopeptide repeat protein [Paludibaculum fermentans]|uniref:tetratricopeptide repeat protein n=1 Tax=Paludibaculum fermentans TaxID=1473598 RepID=UPI003EB814EC